MLPYFTQNNRTKILKRNNARFASGKFTFNDYIVPVILCMQFFSSFVQLESFVCDLDVAFIAGSLIL